MADAAKISADYCRFDRLLSMLRRILAVSMASQAAAPLAAGILSLP
ncbi:hypothetical protein [Accumulibacter sp.]|nr:hypothetical protein [Accumulibacter sp.]